MDIEIPGYQLIRTIGKGGMATVFLAKQSVLERKVALKVMSRALAEETAFGERFMREARIVSQLVHPNIVTVHEVGQHEGRYFLSMEYIDGHDLRTVGKKLDILGKIRVIEDIARALHYAGEKGYVHRDIKPENIMFRAVDGSAVLTDFGIAKAVKTDLSMTQTGTAIGTPHYMSPEQAKGKSVDHRSDLYSLGVVFYQLLVGRVPYDAETAVAIGIKHITEPLPVLPKAYEALQPILDGLLAKSVDNRYQSGLALLNDLRTIDVGSLKDAEREGQEGADGDALTVLSNTDFVDDEESQTDRFTIEFETNATVERPLPNVWPTIFAALFVLCAVLLFVYFSRPAVLEPVISNLEQKTQRYASKLSSEIERGSSYVEEKTKEYLPDPSTEVEVDAEASPRQSLAGALEKPGVSSEANVNPDADLASEPDNSDVASAENSSAEGFISADSNADIDAAAQDPSAEETAVIGAEANLGAADTEIKVVELIPLSALVAERDLLVERVKLDKASLPMLVDKLYEILNTYPSDADTNEMLKRIRSEREENLFEQAAKGKVDAVETLLAQDRRLFSQESEDARNLREREARSLLNRFALMSRAQQQLQEQKVTVPEGDNAVTTLERVLKSHPGYEPALELLNGISTAYLNEARAAFNSDDLARAQVAVQRSLKANSSNSEAQTLSLEIEQKVNQEQQLTRRLDQAKTYSEHGFLYTPEGANAYDEYQAALGIDAKNEQAQQGLENLVDQLSVQIWELVGEARFAEARALLMRPLQIAPDNERLLAMHAAINEAEP